MGRIILQLTALVLLAASALARPVALDVSVTDAHGAAIADAVITAAPQSVSRESEAISQRVPRTHVIDQRNETFIPYVEVFRPGDSVIFRNSDRTRHHAYSFSSARQFDFVLGSGEDSPPMVLDKIGTIAVGCNIHDKMITFFYITDAPWFARSEKSGKVQLDLPAGTYAIRAWHPLLPPGAREDVRIVSIAADSPKEVAFSLQLMPDPRASMDRERVGY
ncbi:MAG: methylamine utilization protein [Rudaea sp.]